MLTLHNINFWAHNKQLLKDISCTARAGEFIIIVGTNGAGKTTLFDIIAGKHVAQQGNISIAGNDVTNLQEQQRATHITRVFQDTNLNTVGTLTVAQNLALAQLRTRPARLITHVRSFDRTAGKLLVQSCGMDHTILDQPMSTLSGGQRQLLAFAMATQYTPKLLLLDEPTAALDPQAATTLLKHVINYVKNHRVTTLLITHDPQIALTLGDTIWVLDQGSISKTYTTQGKASLKPKDLVGQIDYNTLQRSIQSHWNC